MSDDFDGIIDRDLIIDMDADMLKESSHLFLALGELLADTDDWLNGKSPGFALHVKDEFGTTYQIEVYLTDVTPPDDEKPELRLVN